MVPINQGYGTVSGLGITLNRSKSLCESFASLVERITTIVFPCLVKRPSTHEGYIELTEAGCIGYDEFESLVIENPPPTYLPPPLPRPPPAPPQFTIRQKDWVAFSRSLRPLPIKRKTTSRLIIEITDRDYKYTLRTPQVDCGIFFDEGLQENELVAEAKRWLSIPMELLKRDQVIKSYEYCAYIIHQGDFGSKGFTFDVQLFSEDKPLAICTAQIIFQRFAAMRPQIEVNLFSKIFFYSNISRSELLKLGSAIHDIQFGRLR